jgi:hypothetical protein
MNPTVIAATKARQHESARRDETLEGELRGGRLQRGAERDEHEQRES